MSTEEDSGVIANADPAQHGLRALSTVAKLLAQKKAADEARRLQGEAYLAAAAAERARRKAEMATNGSKVGVIVQSKESLIAGALHQKSLHASAEAARLLHHASSTESANPNKITPY